MFLGRSVDANIKQQRLVESVTQTFSRNADIVVVFCLTVTRGVMS